jgi:hypothetical protein
MKAAATDLIVFENMKTKKSIHIHSIPRLLFMVPVIYSIAFAACSDVAGTAGTHATVNLHENTRKADENWLPPGRAEGQPYNRYGPRAFQTGG